MPKEEKKTGVRPGSPPPEATELGTPLEHPVTTTPTAADDSGTRSKASFPIVGIGASAGGLAAFEAFFSGMPTDTDSGMAFVLVQHLAPDHKSILTDLVKRYTRMQVFEVEDGMAVQPNCAYIIPPNRDMAFLDGTLQLLEPAAPRGLRLPIDFFFRSLAQDLHERAICIVLSGTGSDGTLGLRAVKGEGGMAMAQNPESTEYDGMPPERDRHRVGRLSCCRRRKCRRNLSPTSLTHLAEHPPSLPGPHGRKRAEQDLHSAARRDRSRLFPVQAKHCPPPRRAAHGRPPDRAVGRVCPLLAADPGRGEALFRDLLIGVTSFFRDRDAFPALESQVIPKLFLGKAEDPRSVFWVPGCSTGEEAYSLAMLLREQTEALKQTFKLQVFATDLDRQAMEQARAGVYPPASPPTSRRNEWRNFSTRSRQPAPTASTKSSATYSSFPSRT